MKKSFKALKISFIMGLLLFSMIAVVAPTSSAESKLTTLDTVEEDGGRSKLISFPAYIFMTFDTTELNKPLIIDQAVSVPITIEYKHDVPKSLFNMFALTPLLQNMIFYGSAIAPMIQVRLDVDGPEWANIHFAQPDVIFDIPNPEQSTIVNTELIISPYREAPAKPYSIDITATSTSAGRVTSSSRVFTVTFTPSYIPMINVKIDKPVREVSPRESVNFGVTITNNANKNTIVRFSYDAPNGWAPVINPREIELPPLGTSEVIFSVKAPYNIGWHDETTSMQIICQPFPSPLTAENLSQYEIAAQVADVRLTNYGFSVSGIEPFLLVLVIILIVIIVVFLYLRKQKK